MCAVNIRELIHLYCTVGVVPLNTHKVLIGMPTMSENTQVYRIPPSLIPQNPLVSVIYWECML